MYKIRILNCYFNIDSPYLFEEVEYADTLKSLYEKTWVLESEFSCISYVVFQEHSIEGWIKLFPPAFPIRNKWKHVTEDSTK